MRRLIIRTDMNSYIATGHVMRCLSIAGAAAKRNIQAIFVSADECGRKLTEERGYEYISLGTAWDDMEGELKIFLEVISSLQPSYVLVDSYYVTKEYMKKLNSVCKVAYIDDLCKEIYSCDTLICYANYYKKFSYEQKYTSKTKLLLGCQYVPLKPSFCLLQEKKIREKCEEVLVLSGGTDPLHFLREFLCCIESRDMIWADMKVVVVCGVYNMDYEKLKERYASNSKVEILQGVHNMEHYMQRADVAVSAGGTSLYELCACGTPTVCYTFADNQLDNARSFQEDGVMIYAGDIREEDVLDNVVIQTELLLENLEKRLCISAKMKKLVDGKGVERIAQSLLCI